MGALVGLDVLEPALRVPDRVELLARRAPMCGAACLWHCASHVRGHDKDQARLTRSPSGFSLLRCRAVAQQVLPLRPMDVVRSTRAADERPHLPFIHDPFPVGSFRGRPNGAWYRGFVTSWLPSSARTDRRSSVECPRASQARSWDPFRSRPQGRRSCPCRSPAPSVPA